MTDILLIQEKEAYTYTKREQKCGHIITKVEWTQTYNERPNTQKLFQCTSLLQQYPVMKSSAIIDNDDPIMFTLQNECFKAFPIFSCPCITGTVYFIVKANQSG